MNTHHTEQSRAPWLAVLPAETGAPAAPWRILLVEDDDVDRLAVRRHIVRRQLNYLLTEAGTVEEAKRLLRSERFDVLLLDEGLPDGSGFDLIEAGAGAPAVFLTGNGDLAHAVRAIKAGAADYLVKDTARAYLEMLPHTLARAMQERRVRAALDATQTQMRRWLDSLPTAAFACDAQGYLTYYNERTCSLWGRLPRLHAPEDRCCGSLHLTQPDGTPVDREARWRALAEQRGVMMRELVLTTENGERKEVLAYTNPVFDAQGVRTGSIHVWVEVTAMKRLERRQRALEAHLADSQKLEAVGTLAGGVAHEFNNLLTSIMGNLQLAELDLTPGHEARVGLEEAIKASRRARDLVQRVLTFSRPGECEPTPVRLDQIAAEAGEVLAATQPAGIVLRTAMAAGCPPVLGQAGEIRQAIMELVANARDALGETGGAITLELHHGEPDLAVMQRHAHVQPRHTLCLAVRDNGPGMSAAVRARIFEPFFTTKPPGRGTGLGLSGIYGMMKRHHGAVAVDSAPGAGTTVRLYFAPAENVPGPNAPAAVSVAASARPRVLLVEDDESVCAVVTMVLRANGCDVRAFNDGSTALAAFRAEPAAWALLLTDLTMPHMSGATLAGAVRAQRPDLPVIVFSGDLEGAGMDEGLQALEPHRLRKPFELVDLLATVRSALAGTTARENRFAADTLRA